MKWTKEQQQANTFFLVGLRPEQWGATERMSETERYQFLVGAFTRRLREGGLDQAADAIQARWRQLAAGRGGAVMALREAQAPWTTCAICMAAGQRHMAEAGLPLSDQADRRYAADPLEEPPNGRALSGIEALRRAGVTLRAGT